jgi:hypothetical protein
MSFFNGVTKRALDETEEFDSETFFKAGENPCRIKSVMEGVSKSGKDMLVVQFENDAGGTIKSYIADSEYKLRILKNLMTSFGISFEDCHNLNKWAGRRGVVVCKEGEEYNGKKYPKVSHYRSIKEEAFEDDIPF